MADDDEKPHDWDPDREKRQTDPIEMAKALAKAYGEEMRAQEAVRTAKMPPPPPMDLQLAVHKITNGYIVVWALSMTGYPSDRANSQEVYADTPAAVVATVLRLTQEHLDGRLKASPGAPPPGAAFGYSEPVEPG